MKHLQDADEIWHAGDFGNVAVSDYLSAIKPLKGVYGNVDGQELRKIHPLHQKFQSEGVNVWMTHIGGYPGNYAPEI
ncbi:MAG TPA: metallophosphoesterase family protein, partial [Bacteroidia bacterium]|nr:metallophosphoesterase family protein [Bacteroidia bacterium]